MSQNSSDNAAAHSARAILFSGLRLRPCPFCGASDLYVNSDIEPKFVACNKCTAFGPTGATESQATERWNKRVATPQG